MVSSEWRSKLDNEISNAARRTARAREVYGQLGPWIRRYRGGAPGGFLAAIAEFESGGKMSSAGDPQLGEVGFFQITSSTPPKFGLPASARFDPQTNVFLGGLEYNVEAVRLWITNPAIVQPGSADNWKLARLAFAIGPSGTQKLIDASGPHERGQVFEGVKKYVDKTGGMALGSQSAGKVWFRVHAVDLTWKAGQAVSGSYGAPEAPPAPPGITYTLPKAVASRIQSGRSSAAVMVVAALVLGFFLLRR